MITYQVQVDVARPESYDSEWLPVAAGASPLEALARFDASEYREPVRLAQVRTHTSTRDGVTVTLDIESEWARPDEKGVWDLEELLP